MNYRRTLGCVAALTSSALLAGWTNAVQAANLTSTDLKFIGAFKVTATTQPEGKTGFGPGRIVVNPQTNSFFINGLDTAHGNTRITLAEFAIPVFTDTDNFDNLIETGPPIQDYSSFIDRIPFKDESENIRGIGGMEIIDGRLFVSTYDDYDALGTAGDNMFIIESPNNLSNSAVTGYFEIQGKTRAAGWMSEIPANLQSELGGDYLIGMARQASVNHRWSMGPSAFSFNKEDLLSIGAGEIVPNIILQDYPLDNRLAENSFNYPRPPTEACPSFVDDNSFWRPECVGDNDLWTEVSRAFYGAIIPGTSTYLTMGYVGGVRYGMAYKNTPVDKNGPCSGECPYDTHDYDNYIWLFDTQDLIDHKNRLTESYDAKPYEYGAIKLQFEDPDGDGYINKIGGADYDAINNRLYILLSQGGETAPLIEVYEIASIRPTASVWQCI